MARKPLTSVLRTAVTAVVAVACLAGAPGASAETAVTSKVRSAATKTAVEIKELTGAYESKVIGCERKTKRSSLCRVRARYTDGLRTCITDVPVRYSGPKARTARAEIADTICF